MKRYLLERKNHQLSTYKPAAGVVVAAQVVEHRATQPEVPSSKAPLKGWLFSLLFEYIPKSGRTQKFPRWSFEINLKMACFIYIFVFSMQLSDKSIH